jgi:hypothetical protein
MVSQIISQIISQMGQLKNIPMASSMIFFQSPCGVSQDYAFTTPWIGSTAETRNRTDF